MIDVALLILAWQAVQPPLNPVYVVGALVSVIYTLVELLKVRSAKKNGNGKFDEADRQKLITLYKQHQVNDQDGVPLWYVPRSMIEGQKELVDLQRESLEQLKNLNRSMDAFKCPYRKEGE